MLSLHLLVLGTIGYCVFLTVHMLKCKKSQKIDLSTEVEKICNRIANVENENKSHFDTYMKSVETMPVTYNLCYDIMKHTNADKVSILQPHISRGELFISCSMELLSGKLQSRKDELSWNKVSIWNDVINKCIKNEFLYYDDASKISNQLVQTKLKFGNSVSVLLFGLYSDNGNWLGELSVEFLSREFTEEDIQNLKEIIMPIKYKISKQLPPFNLSY